MVEINSFGADPMSVLILYIYTTQFYSNLVITVPAVFEISAAPWTLTGKTWVGQASFPSLPYINFGKIVLRSSKFQILFWRLCLQMSQHHLAPSLQRRHYWLQVKVCWHINDLGCHFVDHKTVWNDQWDLFTRPSILTLYVRGPNYLGFN